MSTQEQGKAPQRTRETADMTAFVNRVLRSIARRAEEGDLEAVSALEAIRETVDDRQLRAVGVLRSEPWNYSWTEVGAELGITRQAAQQRFGG